MTLSYSSSTSGEGSGAGSGGGSSGSSGGGSSTDTTAPSAFSIIGMEGGTDVTPDNWLTSTTVNASWTASSDLGGVSYDAYIRDTSDTINLCSGTALSGASHTFSACSLSEGASYLLKVTAMDPAGNTTAATNGSFSFTVDTQSPSLVISNPADGTTAQNGLTVSGSCESGLALTLGGAGLSSPTSASCSSGAFSVPITFTSVDGSKTISLTQTDAAGNTTTLARAFTKDTTPPAVTVNQKAGQADPTSSLTIEFSIVFNEPIDPSSFQTSDLSQSGTASISSWTITDSGDHRQFTISATPSNFGTVTPSIGAGNVQDLAGNTNTASTSTDNTVTYSLLSLTVDKVYPNNGNWNDYIKFSNTSGTIFNQTDTACDGTETGYYGRPNGCIHGGELRKVVVSNRTGCSSLSIDEDTVGDTTDDVFEWTCDVSGGFAVFSSLGLKPNKGLRDLIQTNGTWKNKMVTIKDGATVIANSTQTSWWGNAISALPSTPNNNTIHQLSTSGVIYFANADTYGFGYNIQGNAISVVTLGSAKIYHDDASNQYNCSTTDGSVSTAGGTIAQFCGGTRKFIWLEVDVDGINAATWPATTGIFMYAWRHSRIHNTTISPLLANSAHYVLDMKQSSFIMTSGLNVFNMSNGIRLQSTSTHNTFKNINVAKVKCTTSCSTANTTYLVTLDPTSSYNRFFKAKLSSSEGSANAYGINIASDYNIFSDVIISNINGNTKSEGVYFASTATDNILSEITIAGTKDAGVYIDGADSNLLSHITSTNNIYNGVYLNGIGTNSNIMQSSALFNSQKPIQSQTGNSTITNSFSNLALLSNTATSIDMSGVSLDLSGYLKKPGSQDVSGATGTPTNITHALVTSYYGKATNDSQSGSGLLSFTGLTSLSLWFELDTPFRSWGLDGGAFPLADNTGFCGSGTCRIWDWRVTSGSPIHNVSINGGSQNPTFTTGTCISGLNGDAADVITTSAGGGVTFLKNALEINNDLDTSGKPIGNDNGLCEANESCIYAPNIGSYQGEGDYQAGGFCTTTGATLTGAKIYAYPITGI